MTYRKTMTAGLCLLLAGGEPAIADDGHPAIEITPYLGYRFAGDFEDAASGATIDVGEDSGLGLILNLRESPNTQWEAIVGRSETSADTAGIDGLGDRTRIDIETLQLGGTYQGSGERARPYLALTLGGTRLSPAPASLDAETYWSCSLGTGLQLFPTSRLGLRLEARAWGTLIDSNSELFCESGIDGAICAALLDGRIFWQVETFAGFVFRF